MTQQEVESPGGKRGTFVSYNQVDSFKAVTAISKEAAMMRPDSFAFRSSESMTASEQLRALIGELVEQHLPCLGGGGACFPSRDSCLPLGRFCFAHRTSLRQLQTRACMLCAKEIIRSWGRAKPCSGHQDLALCLEIAELINSKKANTYASVSTLMFRKKKTTKLT